MNSAHPELAHAVHQCARFCADPKASHEVAVKHIIRYLLPTQERNGRPAPIYGLNMRPNMNRGLEVYAGAAFAREWNSESSEEPISVLSRIGYIIKYANYLI
eukprot:15054248-Ditylum_brightwellii.AAC.1